MPKIRNLVWIAVCLLAFPAAACAETTACDLLTKADVEEITGMKVTDIKLQNLNLCAGFCESTTGTRCIYFGTVAGAQHLVDLSEELPPYVKLDMLGFEEEILKEEKSRGVQTAEMQVRGLPAFWRFYPGSQSTLHIVDGDQAHFLIGETDVCDYDLALRHAQAMAARVCGRYKAQ